MGNEQKMIDRIIADAKQEAQEILDKAKSEADLKVNSANEKAEKEMASYTKLAEAEAEKAASKEISGAYMEAKKQILSKKQEILEEVILEAKNKLLNLKDNEYEEIILNMIEKSNCTDDSEIVLSKKDKKTLKDVLSKKGIKGSDETRDITGGFIVKKGDIEYNYSFEAIIAVEHEYIEQIAAEILFN
ncbi:ATP synthase subunit E [Clostridioides difficile]|uniref:V-type ATP synthase subunit E n=1 Tax=Clostridioides difficile TaxID=1496 RepID=UPI0028A504BD|nr:V-type ATP synthase subunit E [Clostridioides difficile]KAK2302130.1 ATP synthase subunit E [Clostridioides difficile]